jgi:hypothetical protein
MEKSKKSSKNIEVALYDYISEYAHQVTDPEPSSVPGLEDMQHMLKIHLQVVIQRRDTKCHHPYVSTCVTR